MRLARWLGRQGGRLAGRSAMFTGWGLGVTAAWAGRAAWRGGRRAAPHIRRGGLTAWRHLLPRLMVHGHRARLWVGRRLRQAMGWAAAHRGTGGRFGRAVAALLRALAAAWAWAVHQLRLFRMRKWGQRGQQPAAAAANAQPAPAPAPARPPTPAPTARPVSHSPRTPVNPTTQGSTMATGMHAAANNVIDAYNQLCRIEIRNLADCRQATAGLPGMFDLAAEATGEMCENLLVHTPADPYDQAMQQLEAQLHKVGSAAQTSQGSLERWTGPAGLEGGVHPLMQRVDDAWEELANAQHPDLNEARQLAGSMPFIYEAGAQAMAMIVGGIAPFARTASAFQQQAEQARAAFEQCRNACDEANAKLGAWVETPTAV